MHTFLYSKTQRTVHDNHLHDVSTITSFCKSIRRTCHIIRHTITVIYPLQKRTFIQTSINHGIPRSVIRTIKALTSHTITPVTDAGQFLVYIKTVVIVCLSAIIVVVRTPVGTAKIRSSPIICNLPSTRLCAIEACTYNIKCSIHTVILRSLIQFGFTLSL